MTKPTLKGFIALIQRIKAGQTFQPVLSNQDKEAVIANQFFDLLYRDGLCTRIDLARAEAVANKGGTSPQEALVKLGLLTEDARAFAYMRLLNIPLATPDSYPTTPVLPLLLKAEFLSQSRVLPLYESETTLIVAFVDPLSLSLGETIEFATGLKVEAQVARPIEFDRAMKALYSTSKADEGDDSRIDTESVDMDVARLRDIASQAPIIKFVNDLLMKAVEVGASDLHFEPLRDRLRVRFRCDGVL